METYTVNILGSEWVIRSANGANDVTFANDPSCGGYADLSCKTIVLRDASERELSVIHADNSDNVTEHTLRHELIHAFLYECGLSECSEWAANEEMIDWLAIQFDKLSDLLCSVDEIMMGVDADAD